MLCLIAMDFFTNTMPCEKANFTFAFVKKKDQKGNFTMKIAKTLKSRNDRIKFLLDVESTALKK